MSNSFENNNSQKRLLTFAGVAIAVLLIIIAGLLYNKYGQDKEIEQKQLELDEAAQVKAELQKEYDKAIEDLDAALAENQNLKGEIDKQKEELGKQKSKIDKMLGGGKKTQKELDAARVQLKSLTDKQQEFLVRIAQLEKENQELVGTTQVLAKEKKELSTTLENEKKTSEQLKTEKEQLNTEKLTLEEKQKQLQEQKEQLSGQVNIASVIKTSNVVVTPYNLRESGKRVKKKYAKNVEILNVCFNVTENEVAKAGSESFYVRIVDPLGTTLFSEDLGSGEAVNKKTNEKFRYTKSETIDYNQQATTACVDWQPGQDFVKGTYEIEVYNKGYLAGKGSVILK